MQFYRLPKRAVVIAKYLVFAAQSMKTFRIVVGKLAILSSDHPRPHVPIRG